MRVRALLWSLYAMRVWLTRKLAHEIDGINLRECQVGDTLDIPESQARLLLVEEWAKLERRSAARPRQRPPDVEPTS